MSSHSLQSDTNLSGAAPLVDSSVQLQTKPADAPHSLVFSRNLPLRERIDAAAHLLRRCGPSYRAVVLAQCRSDSAIEVWATKFRKGERFALLAAVTVVLTVGFAAAEFMTTWLVMPAIGAAVMTAVFIGSIWCGALSPTARLAYALGGLVEHPLASLREMEREWKRVDMPEGLRELLEFCAENTDGALTSFLIRVDEGLGPQDMATLLGLVGALKEIRASQKMSGFREVALDGEDKELLARVSELFQEKVRDVVHVRRVSP